MKSASLAFGTAASTWLLVAPAAAQPSFDLGADTVLSSLEVSFDQWLEVGLEYARGIFFYFATMQMVWTLAWAVLGAGGLSDVLVSFTREFARQGVFYGILVRAEDWIPGLVDSLRGLGQRMALSAGAIRPEQLPDSGLELIGLVWEHASMISPTESLALLTGAAFVFLLYAWVGIMYFITLVSAQFVMAGGAVLLGLGGSQWTAGFARRYIEFAVRAGLKLLVLELLIGLFQSQVLAWIDIASDWSLMQDLRTMFAVGFSALLLAIVTTAVPGLVAGMASGALVSAGESAVGRAISTAVSMGAGMALGGGGAAAAAGGAGAGGGGAGGGALSATERAAAAAGVDKAVWGAQSGGGAGAGAAASPPASGGSSGGASGGSGTAGGSAGPSSAPPGARAGGGGPRGSSGGAEQEEAADAGDAATPEAPAPSPSPAPSGAESGDDSASDGDDAGTPPGSSSAGTGRAPAGGSAASGGGASTGGRVGGHAASTRRPQGDGASVDPVAVHRGAGSDPSDQASGKPGNGERGDAPGGQEPRQDKGEGKR